MYNQCLSAAEQYHNMVTELFSQECTCPDKDACMAGNFTNKPENEIEMFDEYKQVCGSGDPHYNTFDGPSVHPQGTCAYSFVKTCNKTQQVTLKSGEVKNLPNFDIISDHDWNSNGWGYKSMTFVTGMVIDYEAGGVHHKLRIHEKINDAKTIYK